MDAILSAEAAAEARTKAARRQADEAISNAKADARAKIDDKLRLAREAERAAHKKASEKALLIEQAHDEHALSEARQTIEQGAAMCERAVALIVGEIIGYGNK